MNDSSDNTLKQFQKSIDISCKLPDLILGFYLNPHGQIAFTLCNIPHDLSELLCHLPKRPDDSLLCHNDNDDHCQKQKHTAGSDCKRYLTLIGLYLLSALIQTGIGLLQYRIDIQLRILSKHTQTGSCCLGCM